MTDSLQTGATIDINVGGNLSVDFDRPGRRRRQRIDRRRRRRGFRRQWDLPPDQQRRCRRGRNQRRFECGGRPWRQRHGGRGRQGRRRHRRLRGDRPRHRSHCDQRFFGSERAGRQRGRRKHHRGRWRRRPWRHRQILYLRQWPTGRVRECVGRRSWRQRRQWRPRSRRLRSDLGRGRPQRPASQHRRPRHGRQRQRRQWRRF